MISFDYKYYRIVTYKHPTFAGSRSVRGAEGQGKEGDIRQVR